VEAPKKAGSGHHNLFQDHFGCWLQNGFGRLREESGYIKRFLLPRAWGRAGLPTLALLGAHIPVLRIAGPLVAFLARQL
jgi:hypothetical protein